MPNVNALEKTRPNYEELVRFLVQPLLDEPDSLSIDSETSKGNQRVLIRLAFKGTEQGRVFGRGGRNIEAVRTVLEAAAIAAGQSVRLEIFGAQGHSQEKQDHHRQKTKRTRKVNRRPRSGSSRSSDPTPRPSLRRKPSE
ncbi:KH domain-containing protein [Spirulina sp. CS-785/01]|uniref:KH domain-containing protein n=1 Tax=Spirulina sp. CS-785/01 TaxID=3021716 RepID=UPI00232AE87F|nr:KH domain-containing protein [Spirulina sp. CS-785/01]MDB9315676.1 KH domain-containing protein [Spirulina sp. CS-785/01]